MRRTCLGIGLSAVLLAGCAGPQSEVGVARVGAAAEPSSRPPEAPAMWTRSFLDRAVLSAAVVEIEGPEILRERLALLRDEFNHEHSERASADGYLIEQRQRADSDGAPIRAQLDELVIAVDERITVKIRPDAPRIVIRASGDVYMHIVDSGRETRTATLTLLGELDTPLTP